MAIRLERAGRPVALLAMLNTFNRAWRSTAHEQSRITLRGGHLLDRVQLLTTRLRAKQPSERLAYVKRRARLTLTRAAERVDQLVFDLADRTGLPRPSRVRKVAYANRWAQARYEAEAYHGPVLMVRAVAPIAGVYPLPLMGWSHALRGDVELLDFDCEQLEFWDVDDILIDVAHQIDERLARSLATSTPQAKFASSGAQR
jgi:thioesterase domain-containing protein